MAACVVDCVINPLKEIAKSIVTEILWPPVKPYIEYWWCFEGNVRDLRFEMGCLVREKRNMDEARLRAESPATEVENWSNEATKKLEEAEMILQGCDDLKAWKIIPRYSVGKSAKEIAEVIAKHIKEGKTIRIADLELKSRKRIEEDIMESLKDGNDRMIAICGLGGVGKTTMAKKIVDRVLREEKLFDEVVTVVVGQPDVIKIQEQIAEMLALVLSEVSSDARARKLCTRLEDPKKKLIIFDDVWKSFKLDAIGVPDRGCKIILISRLRKVVCEEMGSHEVIEINCLEKTEAWKLFSQKSGVCVNDRYLGPIAEKVAAECKGLPIALATVGTALKNKSIQTWNDAHEQLRGANPQDFPEVMENVYKPLKLSYDNLETEREKSLFLLCCLFPEDYNIRIEDLALISFGLRLFQGINNIEQGRNRTYSLVERLRSCFLLMTGGDEHEVKMHDVVRDVAIYIGSYSEEKQGFLKSLAMRPMDLSSKYSSYNCNWMSVDISIVDAKFAVGLDFPNLNLLMILNSKVGFDVNVIRFDVNVIRFEGMKELTVLYFSHQNFKSLPSSMKSLKNLRKLHLDNCKVKDITVVGELESLEILRIWLCEYIEELPVHVGELECLRLLELSNCKKLKIVAGVISNLVGVGAKLKIVGCFNKREAKGNLSEERNASLSKLESLGNLTSLKIEDVKQEQWQNLPTTSTSQPPSSVEELPDDF